MTSKISIDLVAEYKERDTLLIVTTLIQSLNVQSKIRSKMKRVPSNIIFLSLGLLFESSSSNTWSRFTATAFQSGSVVRRNNLSFGTQRFTLKEPDAPVENSPSKKNPKKDKKGGTKNVDEEVPTAPKATTAKEQEPETTTEAEELVPDLSPTQDEEKLSRDEEFMRMAIDLAEEEYVYHN